MATRQSALALNRSRNDSADHKANSNKLKMGLSRSRREKTKSKIEERVSHVKGGSSVLKEPPQKTSFTETPHSSSSRLHDRDVVPSDEVQPPLDVTIEDSEYDDLPGLKFCSQEAPLDTSCDSDAQCEVRWDCYSPETVKQLKKLSGQHNAEGVKRIVANFNDAHVKPKKPSTLIYPLRGPEPTSVFKEVSMPRRRAKQPSLAERVGTKRRVDREKAVQEMILLLQGRVAQQEKELRSSNVDSEDLQPSSATSIDEDSSSKLTATNAAENQEEDCWSDDDLFQDNSFLIEATQNPEKFINTSVDISSAANNNGQPKCGIKTGFGAQSDSPTPSLIPSSCVQKSSHLFNKPDVPHLSIPINDKPLLKGSKPSNVIVVRNTSLNTNLVKQTAKVAPTQHVQFGLSSSKSTSNQKASSYNAKFKSSVNSFVKQSSQVSPAEPSSSQQSRGTSFQNSQTITTLPPGAKVKTSFKKFNSFQAHNSSSIRRTVPSSQNPGHNSSLNTTFKRTMSFDSSYSPTTHSHNDTPVVIKPKPFLTNSKSSTSKDTAYNSSCMVATTNQNDPMTNRGTKTSMFSPGKCTKLDVESPKATVIISGAPADDGFDMNLSEDMLQQFLDVDDVLDSQADILSTGKPTVSAATSSKPVSSPSLMEFSMATSPPTSVNGAASALRVGLMGKLPELRSSTPIRPFKQKATFQQPNSSTPSKQARPADKAGKDNTFDSGSELFDSFLNEEMYQTQILPFLEKIETETNATTSSNSRVSVSEAQPSCADVGSPVKCSPEEIEQKRQAALQRRSLRLSQMNNRVNIR